MHQQGGAASATAGMPMPMMMSAPPFPAMSGSSPAPLHPPASVRSQAPNAPSTNASEASAQSFSGASARDAGGRGGGGEEEGGHWGNRQAGIGVATPARCHRRHAHDELVGVLPTLVGFDKPLLLQDKGDNGAAALTRLRALVEAQHADKASPVPQEEVRLLRGLRVVQG